MTYLLSSNPKSLICGLAALVLEHWAPENADLLGDLLEQMDLMHDPKTLGPVALSLTADFRVGGDRHSDNYISSDGDFIYVTGLGPIMSFHSNHVIIREEKIPEVMTTKLLTNDYEGKSLSTIVELPIDPNVDIPIVRIERLQDIGKTKIIIYFELPAKPWPEFKTRLLAAAKLERTEP